MTDSRSTSIVSAMTTESKPGVVSTTMVANNANEIPCEETIDLLDTPQIKEVMNSDVSVNVLLTRMKQSLLICEELTKFIRKKYIMEEDHTQQLAKTFKHFFAESSSGSSLQRSIHSVLEIDGKLAQVKQSYVSALQKMYEELSALLLTMTKMRKSVKEHSRRLEKDVADAIHSAEKAKSRYNSLCQDWEKLRMADPTKTKLTLRGSKTTKEQEEELQRKIDSADLDYKQRVDHSTSLRNTFVSRERPKIVYELKDLILELDTAVAIQLQKYTIWTENLILNSGVTVTPFETGKSMKAIASSVTNERDLYNHLNKYNQTGKNNGFVNKNLIPVDYKKHPSMVKAGGNTTSKSSFSKMSGSTSSSPGFVVNPANNSMPKRVVSTSHETPFISNPTSSTTPITATTATATTATSYAKFNTPNSYGTSFSNKPTALQTQGQPTHSTLRVINDDQETTRKSHEHQRNGDNGNFSSLDPGNNTRATSLTASMATSAMDRPLSHVQTNATLPPGINKNFKTFGVPLESLLEYEQDMVPALVRQCIYVIDKYGLDLEGIYRKSANVLDVSKLKDEIDRDPSNISMILPPKNYTDSDIYLAASLLKTFFSNLPDSLLPRDMASEVKTCLSIEDPVTRKNYMHGLIYKLPDGQYWTLRSLIFHLKRVLQHESTNRMNVKSMCIIWGPTIISPDEEDVNGVNYQITCMEVLFDVAEQAFEPE